MSTYVRRDDWVQDALGNAISGAGVYVCSQPANTSTIPPSPLVQLYADPNGVTPITQPVQTDGYGHAAYYVAQGTYTVVYYSPRIQTVVLADQGIGNGASITVPVPVNQGGTGATTAPNALVNLSAAGRGANADITSLSAIPNTTINNAGYVFNGGTAATTTTFQASGWQYGSGTFASANGVFVGNQTWTGTGYSGPAVASSDNSGHFALVGTTGFFTSGTVQGNFIKSLGNLAVQTGGVTQCDTVQAYTVGAKLLLSGLAVTGAGSVGVQIAGNSNAGQSLLALGDAVNTYPTQTTVGAAGGASALPATPVVYLPLKVLVAGVMTEVVIPCYPPS